MGYLRTASFGGLFSVTFAVAATCQVVFSLIGIVAAVMAPGIFKMNGEAATNPTQAIGVLVFLLLFGLVVNAGMSAIGSGLWIGLRTLLPRPKTLA
ncbi:MAG: hypothetical protein ACOVMT_11450 [Caulobacter sp.]